MQWGACDQPYGIYGTPLSPLFTTHCILAAARARERISVHGLPSKMELKKVRKFKIHGMKKHLIAYTLCSSASHYTIKMANLRTVLETYCAVQRLSTRDDIFRRTTFDQRLTISLREFLSVSDIFDESLLADYEVFVRKSPIAAGFRCI